MSALPVLIDVEKAGAARTGPRHVAESMMGAGEGGQEHAVAVKHETVRRMAGLEWAPATL